MSFSRCLYDALDLYYYRARYYDPTIGRFITPDPIGFMGGDTNFYRYVGNDPVNFVDYSGFSAIPSSGVQNLGGESLRETLTPHLKSQVVATPKPSNGGGSLQRGPNNGAKVGNYEPKVEHKTILHFIFYTTVGSPNDPKFKNAAQKRYKDLLEDLGKRGDAKRHLVFLAEANSKSAMENYIKQKIDANGGTSKTFIGSIEATTELYEKNTLYKRVKGYFKSIRTDTDQYQPTSYFSGNIDAATINSYNQNIIRNEAHNKYIMSPEHQKKVYKMVADDCDSASKWTGFSGAALLVASKKLPGGFKVISAGIGVTLVTASGILGGGKLVFKYLADDLQIEEAVTDIVLSRTVYVKNELVEFLYDEAFSKIAEFFYED